MIDANFNRSPVDLPLAEKPTTTNDRSTENPVNAPGQNTYRCYSSSLTDTALSSESLTARSTDTSSRTTARVERRCKIVNVLVNDGQDESKRDKYNAFGSLYLILILSLFCSALFKPLLKKSLKINYVSDLVVQF